MVRGDLGGSKGGTDGDDHEKVGMVREIFGGSKGGTDGDGHEKVGMVREILEEARVEPMAMVMRRLEWFGRSWRKQGWNRW